MLIDGRHGVKDSDKEMMKLLGDASLPYQVIYFVELPFTTMKFTYIE